MCFGQLFFLDPLSKLDISIKYLSAFERTDSLYTLKTSYANPFVKRLNCKQRHFGKVEPGHVHFIKLLPSCAIFGFKFSKSSSL